MGLLLLVLTLAALTHAQSCAGQSGSARRADITSLTLTLQAADHFNGGAGKLIVIANPDATVTDFVISAMGEGVVVAVDGAEVINVAMPEPPASRGSTLVPQALAVFLCGLCGVVVQGRVPALVRVGAMVALVSLAYSQTPCPVRGATVYVPINHCWDLALSDQDVAHNGAVSIVFTPPGDGCNQICANADGDEVILFDADPTVAFRGIDVPVVAYLAGMLDNTTVLGAKLTLGSTVVTPALSVNPTNPNVASITVPSGLAAGRWTLSVLVPSEAGVNCTVQIEQGLLISSNITIDVQTINPSFVEQSAGSSITITSAGGFIAVPRVYLSGTPAVRLTGVSWISSTEISATVPPSVAAGAHDVIVVNPDEKIGVIESGLTIVTTPPPVVASVVPSTIRNNADKVVTIYGANFEDGSAVTMECAACDAGAPLTISATTVTFVSSSSLHATFVAPDLGSLGAGTISQLRVASPSGPFFVFNSVATASNSYNPGNFVEQSEAMNSARRGLALVVAKPTPSSKFMYAIGGDNAPESLGADAASAFATVEYSSIDYTGTPGSWQVQRTTLPAAVTLTRAVTVGQYIYVVGGQTAAGSSGAVYRAQVLSPSTSTPVVLDRLQISEDNSSFTGGQYYYRVSAVYDGANSDNPGGEGLPGDVLSLKLPNINGIKLYLSWNAVPDAVTYRLYRTPAANGNPTSDLELLAEVSAPETSFVDDGGPSMSAATPPPFGSLGNWAAVDSLNTPRYMHALAASRENMAFGASGPTFIYALGGSGTSDLDVLSDYEYTSITITPASGRAAETHTVAPWTAVVSSIALTRTGLRALQVDNSRNQNMADGESYIYLAGGNPSGDLSYGSTDPALAHLQAALVTSTGELGAWTTSAESAPSKSFGYCLGLLGEDYLHTGGTLRTGIETKGATLPFSTPVPQLGGSSGNTGAFSTSRSWMDCVIDTIFVFGAGGTDSTSALATVEKVYCCQ